MIAQAPERADKAHRRDLDLSIVAAICFAATSCVCMAAIAQDTSKTQGAAKEKQPAEAHATPRSRQQALFERINLAEAWQITRGDPTVLIGVVDNGYDFFHPDLKGQLLPGYYYPGGFHTEFYENIAHGTAVAGIMVAKGESPDSISGLAPKCRVLTASQGTIEQQLLKLQRRVLHENSKATLADIQREMSKDPMVADFAHTWVRFQIGNAADAIRYLVDHGAKVINISGAVERSLCPLPEMWQKIQDSFAYAAHKDVIIVLAAGNSATKWEDYPGEADTVIVVGASLLNDTRWEQPIDYRGETIKQGSCFGNRLTVMAPVESLLVCVPHEKRVYEIDDGPSGPTKVKFEGLHSLRVNGATSSAAPIVSSLVALIYSARGELDAKSVVAIVRQGCDDIGDEGYDIMTGYGRINFGKSLRLAKDWPR